MTTHSVEDVFLGVPDLAGPCLFLKHVDEEQSQVERVGNLDTCQSIRGRVNIMDGDVLSGRLSLFKQAQHRASMNTNVLSA